MTTNINQNTPLLNQPKSFAEKHPYLVFTLRSAIVVTSTVAGMVANDIINNTFRPDHNAQHQFGAIAAGAIIGVSIGFTASYLVNKALSKVKAVAPTFLSFPNKTSAENINAETSARIPTPASSNESIEGSLV